VELAVDNSGPSGYSGYYLCDLVLVLLDEGVFDAFSFLGWRGSHMKDEGETWGAD
jgi:hypothetical protein